MEFFSGIEFFLVLTMACIPAIILGVLEKSLKYYRIIASAIIIILFFSDDMRNFVFLISFLVLELLLIKIYLQLRRKGRKPSIYRTAIALSLLPLLFCKVSEITSLSIFQFLGVSYLSFRVVQIIIEIYDGIIKEFKILDYFDFLLLFSTFSSGPIDRSRRFLNDANITLERLQYLELLGAGIQKIIIGVFYKFVLSIYIYQYVQAFANVYSPLKILEYSYAYGLYMFFDFAGYSFMAIGASYIFGIRTPENFNKPFMSLNMKEFWNRWHMSLSFWFRDFLFSRIVMVFIRKKCFKSKLTGASIAFVINMAVMGLWHGLAVQYILYGIYHGVLLAATEIYEKKATIHRRFKNEYWYKCVSWLLTINFVMFGFLIFSGEFTDIIRILISKI